jgi:hypothetical protein
MIIKIKKRDLAILLILLSIIPIVFAAQKTQYFTVTVSMTNRGPTIFYVNVTNVTLIAGSTATIDILFNVSDPDGFGDLNDSSAKVNVTLNGVSRGNSSCNPTDYDINYTQYACSVTFYYFDNASTSWVVNASVSDNSRNQSTNDTNNLQVRSLSSLSIVSNLTFTSIAVGQQDATPTSDFILNNTGNFDFFTINVTAYDLIGISDSSKTLGAGNFTVNTTDAAAGLGMQLQNATSMNLTGALLPHKTSDLDILSNETIYFWLDVPNDLTVQNYNSTTNWAIIVE